MKDLDQEAEEFAAAVAGRAWEEADLIQQAVELMVRLRQRRETDVARIADLEETVRRQQALLLKRA